MKWLLILIACARSAAWPQEDHAHLHGNSAPTSGEAQIIVTINPEARVSVERGAPLPPPASCGSATELKIKVINQGFVTAPLRAAIVGVGAEHVTLHFDGTKLTGGPEEGRVLHVIPRGSNIVDVTLAFSLEKNIGDLGGRDRVHLLVRCESLPSKGVSGRRRA